MANPIPVKIKKERRKSEQRPVWKFEIIEESSDLVGTLWSRLDRTLQPFIEAAHEVLGDIYATIAKGVLQKKEAFDDLRAERKARQRTLPRKARSSSAAHEIRLAGTGTGLRNALASTSKTRA
jgi:hypothetical protein